MRKNAHLEKTIDAWSVIGKKVFVPYTEDEYQRLVDLLDNLIEHVGENDDHPLASMMDVIGVLIETYETEHIPELDGVM